MKTNKILPDSSINKVWENFRKMNGIVIELLASNWVFQDNGTFTNTVEYEGFTSDEILEVDLYNDGNLTETQISEYDGYITEFNVEDGQIVAVATTKPTQSIKILARGEIVGKMVVNGGDSSNVSASNVFCLDKDGKISNVQKELDEQNKIIKDLNLELDKEWTCIHVTSSGAQFDVDLSNIEYIGIGGIIDSPTTGNEINDVTILPASVFINLNRTLQSVYTYNSNLYLSNVKKISDSKVQVDFVNFTSAALLYK